MGDYTFFSLNKTFLHSFFFFFTQVSETISFWLRSRQPTGNCTSWGAKEKKKKKVSGRFLFCSAGMEHNMLVKDLTVLFWHLTLFVYMMELLTFDRSFTQFLFTFCFQQHGAQYLGKGSKSSYFGIWHFMFMMEVLTFDRSCTQLWGVFVYVLLPPARA